MQAPAGWIPTTAEGMLFAMTPRGNQQNAAFMVQEVSDQQLQGVSAQDAVRNNFQQMGLQYLGSRQTSVSSGQRFVIDQWTGQTQSWQVGVETTQFPHGDHVAVMIFLTPSLNQYQSPLGEVLQRAVIDLGRARSAQPARIKVDIARAGDTWSELARRATGNAGDAEEIANMNGFDVRDAVPSGILVKLPAEVVRE
jgi:predicted Zn-dependent protease